MDIKSWWENLELRERRLIGIGGGCTFVILLYFYAWQPFAAKVASLRAQVKNDQALVAWLQPAVQKVQALRSQGAVPQQRSTQSLLVTINQAIEQAQLTPFVSQIQQADGNKVTVRFAEVPFDHLIKWLGILWQQYGIKLDQLSLSPLKTQGLVTATLTLSAY